MNRRTFMGGASAMTTLALASPVITPAVTEEVFIGFDMSAVDRTFVEFRRFQQSEICRLFWLTPNEVRAMEGLPPITGGAGA